MAGVRRTVAEDADTLPPEPAVRTAALLRTLGRMMPDVPLVPFAVPGERVLSGGSGRRGGSDREGRS
ncbi:hypothetical protein [Nocardiopsis alborubida]|uniref:Uncharacterized protein n=1 Tax=Nocardiopsis alborubida TaxID=146802 RepID=A0A7X6MGC1_9ACTN|nr:hypothetical protein [Nocardiopsis alborubida]NKZ00446.1 hypothetical protein [Nocardiopsis alborubida]